MVACNESDGRKNFYHSLVDQCAGNEIETVDFSRKYKTGKNLVRTIKDSLNENIAFKLDIISRKQEHIFLWSDGTELRRCGKA